MSYFTGWYEYYINLINIDGDLTLNEWQSVLVLLL